MLPIANRPHIEHVFDLLEKCGVGEIVLLTSYLAEHFAGVVENAAAHGLDFAVAHEEKPLGTAGAFKNAQDLVGDEAFLAFNGDILTDIDLNDVLGFHRKNEAEATIVLTPVEDPSACGVVPTAADGRVLGFVEKPPPGEAPTDWINAGTYVLEPSVLDTIPPGRAVSIERETFPALLRRDAKLYALAAAGYWLDIGTPSKYLQANLDRLDGGASLCPPDATVDAGATVESSVLGPGAAVAA